MLVARLAQSTWWQPTTPTIAPSRTIAAWKPSLSATWRRVRRMKASESSAAVVAGIHGIHGSRCARLRSLSANSSSASDSSSRRRSAPDGSWWRSTALRRDGLGPELLADRDVDRVIDRQHDQGRHIQAQRVAQVAGEVVDRLAAEARDPERLGQPHEVGVREVHAEMLAELPVLLPHDRPELAVLPHDVHDRRLQPHRRLELLAVHEEAAVAVDGDHLAVGMHELGGDGARDGESH